MHNFFLEIFQENKLLMKLFRQGFLLEISQLKQVFWKCSNKATFRGNFPTKPVVVEIFQPNKVLWKYSIRTTYFVEICKKGIFLEPSLKGIFCENFQQVEFMTKQRKFWWKFPQNPTNGQNLCAATLSRCKGFCDSGYTWTFYSQIFKKMFPWEKKLKYSRVKLS